MAGASPPEVDSLPCESFNDYFMTCLEFTIRPSRQSCWLLLFLPFHNRRFGMFISCYEVSDAVIALSKPDIRFRAPVQST